MTGTHPGSPGVDVDSEGAVALIVALTRLLDELSGARAEFDGLLDELGAAIGTDMAAMQVREQVLGVLASVGAGLHEGCDHLTRHVDQIADALRRLEQTDDAAAMPLRESTTGRPR